MLRETTQPKSSMRRPVLRKHMASGRPTVCPTNARRRVSASLLAAFSSALVAAALASAAEQAPPALVHAGAQLGCRIPKANPGDPTSAWVIEREAGTAYAGWCARDGDRLYDLLVTAVSPQHPWALCPGLIRLGIDRPFPSLRATMLPRDLPYRIELSEFWYLRGNDYVVEQGPPVLGSGVPQGPALDMGLGDAGQILLCFAGSWIMGGYH